MKGEDRKKTSLGCVQATSPRYATNISITNSNALIMHTQSIKPHTVGFFPLGLNHETRHHAPSHPPAQHKRHLKHRSIRHKPLASIYRRLKRNDGPNSIEEEEEDEEEAEEEEEKAKIKRKLNIKPARKFVIVNNDQIKAKRVCVCV